MGNGKQSTEAASGQGVGGARRCLLTESVINSFRVAAPLLISTACPVRWASLYCRLTDNYRLFYDVIKWKERQ